METFSALLVICAGNSPVPGEFPAQRPMTRSFVVFFDLRLNKRLSKQSWCWWFQTLSRPLWRHSNDICRANDIVKNFRWGLSILHDTSRFRRLTRPPDESTGPHLSFIVLPTWQKHVWHTMTWEITLPHTEIEPHKVYSKTQFMQYISRNMPRSYHALVIFQLYLKCDHDLEMWGVRITDSNRGDFRCRRAVDSPSYIYYVMWEEITYPFSNCNGVTVEVWKCINNFMCYFAVPMINFYARINVIPYW